MNGIDFIFMLQFVIFLGLFLFTLWRTFNLESDFRYTAMIFILSLLCYGTGMFLMLADNEEFYISLLFRLESMILPIIMLFLIISIFYKWSKKAEESTIKPYFANQR